MWCIFVLNKFVIRPIDENVSRSNRVRTCPFQMLGCTFKIVQRIWRPREDKKSLFFFARFCRIGVSPLTLCRNILKVAKSQRVFLFSLFFVPSSSKSAKSLYIFFFPIKLLDQNWKYVMRFIHLYYISGVYVIYIFFLKDRYVRLRMFLFNK